MTQEKKQSFFGKIGQKIKNVFKYLHPLVAMQLKDKLDFSITKDKKKTLFKVIWSIVLFVLITAVITLLFTLIVKFGIFSFLEILNFRAFLVLMTVVLALSFISCLITVTDTLYFAKDNPVLLTMPVKNSTIFTSKLIVCFIYELMKNLAYILPFLFAYGLCMHLSFAFFIWSILSVVFLTIIFIAISGLLSIPAMAISIAFKKHKFLEFIVIALVAGAIVVSVIGVISQIPEDIDLVRDWGKIYWSIQDFLADFASKLVFFDYFLQFLTGMAYASTSFSLFTSNNLITFAILLGILLVCLGSVYLLSKPLFLKMASTPFEYKKKTISKFKRNHVKRPFVSSAVQQSRKIFRTSNLIYSLLAIAVITPIAIFLQNKIISAMDTRLTGQYMAVAFNILIILLLMLSSNNILASVFSREGNSAYLNKVNPVPYSVPLTGKLVLNALISVVSIFVSAFVLNIFAHFNIMYVILLAFSMSFIYIAHLFWSAELDVMNPQNRYYQTTGKNLKNPNERKSTIIAFALSAIFAFVAYFLMRENIQTVFIKLFFITLILLILRTYLYFTKIKLYYKEKAV